MSSRTRSTRSTKVAAQAKITDAFNVTRSSRVRGPAKKVLENETSVASQNVSQTHQTQKDVVSGRKTMKKARGTPAKGEPEIPAQEIVTLTQLAPPSLESPQRRTRKTPTPTATPERPTTAVRRLNFNVESKPAENTLKEISESTVAVEPAKLLEPSQSTNSEPELSILPEQQVPPRAEKPKARSGAELLKWKLEKKKKEKQLQQHNISPQKPLQPSMKIPAYTLPTFKTPQKEENLDEKIDEESKRQRKDLGRVGLLPEAVRASVDAQLPVVWSQRCEEQKHLDMIVSFAWTQGNPTRLSGLIKQMERITGRRFSREKLGQVVGVYPEAYNITGEETQSITRFDLRIVPNIKDDLTGYLPPESPQKRMDHPGIVVPTRLISPMKSPRKKCLHPMPREAQVDVRPRLEGWRMTCRSRVFRHRLVQKMNSLHSEFLKEKGFVVDEPRRLHPEFLARIDSLCPALELGTLPEPPKKNADLTTMKDYMAAVDTAPIPNAVEKALEELRSPQKPTISTSGLPLSPKKFAQIQSATPKNGAVSLLERIRAREAAKKALEATRDPAMEKRAAMLRRLDQKLLRVVLGVFIQKQRKSVELVTAVDKISYTVSGSITKAEITCHLEVLCDVAKEFFCIKEVRGIKYLQITSNSLEEISKVVRRELERISSPTVRVESPRTPAATFKAR